VYKLIGLLGNEGDARPGRTETPASGAVFMDAARCRAQRLPRRMPYACIASRQTDPPSPELLGRVLEGLKRL
jgi:hypothetical protein